MLRRLKDLEHWAVLSREGDDLGAVQDFYFDDERWTVRYVVVKAGRWFTGRLVFLSPMSLDRVQWDQAHLQAIDGEIGHIDDFLVDDRTWTIRYLLIDTSNWIGGRAVLIPPERAWQVDWQRRLVHVDLARQEIEDSREYDPAADISGVYRIDLATAED